MTIDISVTGGVMGRKLGLTLEDVVRAASTIADEGGIEGMNLAAVAEKLGVRPPSLYHHVDGIDSLRRHLAMHGARELTESFTQATRGVRGKKALLAVARAYRAFARKHPGHLAAMLPAPRAADDPALFEALAAPVAEITRILTELGISGDDAVHVVRALRSYLHGFIDLERLGGFGLPHKVDTSFELGLELFADGIGAR
jgi:AcrR family transcriptional regulator